MYKSASDTGYAEGNCERFEGLRGLAFDSILDVGSGPCLLHYWLKTNDIVCDYEAYDVRLDALELCECKTHRELPKQRYDLVCLFGVYNIYTKTIEKEKAEFLDLLVKCRELCGKYLVFTRMKDTINIQNAPKYSLDEIDNMMSYLKLSNYRVSSTSDNTEYLIICEINYNETNT